MDANPLFKLFSQYSEAIKRKQPGSDVYLTTTAIGRGYVTIVYNGESMTPFSWEDIREGLHKLRIEIPAIKSVV